MERRKRGEKDFAGLEEVTEVRAGVRSAGIALAGRIEGVGIFAITGLLDDDAAGRSKQVAIAGVARWQYAVHHIDAARDVLRKLFGHANAHDVAGPVLRE